MVTTDLLQLGGFAIAIAALLFTAYGVDQARRTGRARFWIDLREQFAKHDDVHLRVRPGGDWSDTGRGPNTPEEWAKVEAYMGLFEHCEIMLQDRLIDLKTFNLIYKYRVGNILANPIIVEEKLRKRATGWEQFIKLTERLRLPIPDAATA